MSLATVAGMARGSLVALLTSATALVACSGVKAIPKCALGEPQAIAFDAVTPEGTSGHALAQRLPGLSRGSLRWFGSFLHLEITRPAARTTTVELDVSVPVMSARYRRGITPPALQGTTCPGAIEVGAALRVVTADGGLDERWTATARQTPDGGVSFTVDLTQQPPGGTLRVVLADAPAWDEAFFGFETTLDASGAGDGSLFYSANRARNGSYEGFGASVAHLTFGPIAAAGTNRSRTATLTNLASPP
jgi:hypothetical protein